MSTSNNNTLSLSSHTQKHPPPMEANNAHYNNYQDIPDVSPLPDLHHFQHTQEWTGSGADDNLAVDVREASAMTTGNSGASVSSTIAKTELMIKKIRITNAFKETRPSSHFPITTSFIRGLEISSFSN